MKTMKYNRTKGYIPYFISQRMLSKQVKLIFYSFLMILLILISLLFAGKAGAQEVNDSQEITVEAPYQPSVSEAYKINLSPRIPEGKLEKPEFSYQIKSKTFETPVTLEPIQPAKIVGESVSKLYKNYIKAGIGNYTTPYFEFFANKLRSKKNAFGVHLKHLSSSGAIKDYAYPGSSLTEASGYGKKFFSDHTFSAEAFYKHTGVHFYGYRPEEFPMLILSKKDIRQSFNQLGLNTYIESNYVRDKKLTHSFLLGYSYLSDAFKTHEQNIRFDANLDYRTGFFDFSESEHLGLEAGVNYYIDEDSLTSENSGIIRFAPNYKLAFAQYSFKVGLDAQVEQAPTTYFHMYPVVRADVQVVKDVLITYAGIYGEIEKNSFQSLSSENPFIISTIEKRFSNNKLSQYGGVRGHISKDFDYNLSFVNSTIENMPFFVNDTTSVLGDGLNNQFTVVYDKVKYSRVIAEFSFHYKDKFNAMLRGKYNNYFLENETEPWHKPNLEISLSADYNMQDKIRVKAELFTTSKTYARTFETVVSNNTTAITEVPVKLDGLFDLNLGLEYRYSKLLSGFINFNNILGQRYYRWYNYPSYRFNVMLGITYSF